METKNNIYREKGLSQLMDLRTGFHDVYQQVCDVFSPLCFVAVAHILTLLRCKAFNDLIISLIEAFPANVEDL